MVGADLEKTYAGVNSITPTGACLPLMQWTSIPNTRIGVTGKHHHMERRSANGPLATTHNCCLTSKSLQGSSLHDGTQFVWVFFRVSAMEIRRLLHHATGTVHIRQLPYMLKGEKVQYLSLYLF